MAIEKNTRVEIWDHEYKLANLTGIEIRLGAVKYKRKGMEASEMGKMDMNIRGFLGEFGLAKMFNVFPDFFIAKEHLPKRPDLKFPNDLKVDVKVASHPDGKLYVQPHKKGDDIDLYALVHIAYEKGKCFLEFKGFMWKKDIFHPDRLLDNKHNTGQSYQASQEELIPVEHIKPVEKP